MTTAVSGRAAVACVVASAGAISVAFPSSDLGGLAWIALVPLCIALDGRDVRAAAGLGAIFAVVTAYGIFGWLFVVPGFTFARFAVLVAYYGLYPMAWCVGVVVLDRLGAPRLFAAPAWWVVLEALRSHAGFLALPWATIAQTQHADVPLLQIAAWAGEAGVSFAVVLANVALADALIAARRPTTRWREAGGVLVAIALLHGAGAARLAGVDHGDAIRVAAIQPHIGLRERDTDEGRAAIWRRLASGARSADAAGADLVVWPETAIGDPLRDPLLAEDLAALSSTLRAPLITGAAETEKFAEKFARQFAPASAVTIGIARKPTYNSAYLVEHGVVVGEPYRKRVLLPFGEYLPLRDRLAWPGWLVPADLVDGTPGVDARTFVVDRGDRALRVATLICWENAFGDLTRRAVEDGAQVIVHLVNDAWFGDTRAADQHDAISVIRAVEHGIPIVVASNDGPSEIIDARGRVVARLERHAASAVVDARLTLAPTGTFYSRYGDGFVVLCLLVLIASTVRMPIVRIARRPSHPRHSHLEKSS